MSASKRIMGKTSRVRYFGDKRIYPLALILDIATMDSSWLIRAYLIGLCCRYRVQQSAAEKKLAALISPSI